MLQLFRDLYRDTVKDEGILGVMKLWFLLLIDFIPSVISQHQQEGGETMRSIVAGDVYSKAVKIGFLALLLPMYILAVELFPIFLPGKPEALNLLPVQIYNTLIGKIILAIVLLGGMFSALLINLLAILHVKVRYGNGLEVNTSIKPKLGNIAILTLVLLLMLLFRRMSYIL